MSNMGEDTDIHLRWNHHQTTLLSVFSTLLNNENLVDCTISAEGQHFKAHRVILSACSPYFESLFSQHYEKHPIVILPDVKFQVLEALIEFMYSGEAKVPEDELCTILKLAETLQIKGLSVTGESDKMDKLRRKRRNPSTIVSDQQRFKKRLHECKSEPHLEEENNVSFHNSERESSEDMNSHLQTTQEWTKNSSKSVSAEKTAEVPGMSQDIKNSESFNVFQYSSLTETLSKLNTCMSGMLMNSVSNILDSNLLPESSRETIGEQTMLRENRVLTHSSSEQLRTSEPPSMCDERPAVDFRAEVKQEDPGDFKGDSIDEIILDDDTDDSDNHNYDLGGDNSSTVSGKMVPEESFSDQGFCNLEQYRDNYVVEPRSVLRNPFKCDACGRSYRYHRSLSRHLKYECGKEPQFRCLLCPARYTHKHNLELHIGKTHSSNMV